MLYLQVYYQKYIEGFPQITFYVLRSTWIDSQSQSEVWKLSYLNYVNINKLHNSKK
jgi:hypothetical protein